MTSESNNNSGEILSKDLSNTQLKDLFTYLLEKGQIQLKPSVSKEGVVIEGKYYCVEVVREDIDAPLFFPASNISSDSDNDNIPPYPPPLITL